MAKTLSGKVKRTSLAELSSDRYNFLGLSEAEPNAGAPAANNGLFASDTDGTRKFINFDKGLTVDGSGFLVVNENTLEIDTSAYNYSSSTTLANVLSDFDSKFDSVDAITLGGESGSYYLDFANFTNGPVISQNTYQVSGTSEQVFDTFDKTLYRSAHYHVNIVSIFNGNVTHQTSQLVVIHDGTTANISQYGDIYLNEEIAEYNVQINGNNVEVTVISNGIDAQVNYVRHLINNTGFTPTFSFNIDLQTEDFGTIDLSTSNIGTFDLNAA